MMRRTSRQFLWLVLSILLGLAPFVFGAIRALQTRSDLRLLWMAFSSALGAALVVAIREPRTRAAKPLTLAATVFVAAALLTGLTAYLLGARAAAGVWGIAFVFGVLWALSVVLFTRR